MGIKVFKIRKAAQESLDVLFGEFFWGKDSLGEKFNEWKRCVEENELLEVFNRNHAVIDKMLHTIQKEKQYSPREFYQSIHYRAFYFNQKLNAA